MAVKRKFVFVILHYKEKTVPDTRECVQSIRSHFPGDLYHIVLVENGSKDKSLELLNELYREDEKVTVLFSDTNLGFARGNNLGCDYARDQFDPDFLIVINNDTFIKQDGFLKKIEELYKEYSFHILGPDIRDRNGHSQNPVYHFPITLEEIDRSLVKLKRKQDCLKSGYLNYYIKFKLKKWIKDMIKKTLPVPALRKKLSGPHSTDTLSRNIQQGIGLHGAALIFSRDYLSRYKDVFFPGTFLYKEEDVLYYRVKAHGLNSLYHPGLVIHHKEDQSTDTVFTNGAEKEAFIIGEQIKSFQAYRDYILEDKEASR